MAVNIFKKHKINGWIVFYLMVYLIIIIKLITIKEMDNNLFFATYSIAVSFYILSRFALAYFYEPDQDKFDQNYEPTISFGVPSKNEEKDIRETILKIAQTDYPKEKFDIIAINDGSTDNTLDEMIKAQKIAKKMGVRVHVTDWKINKGKREGMAECVKKSKNEIIIFIDSDSFVRPDTAKELVKYFSNKKIAAVAGHAYVANGEENFLTKMQDVRYFVAFKAYKSSEALFSCVTCCSGCCSAYRKSYVLEVLDSWLNQKFLGVKCTYGDDRSLTNFLLKKGYKALFSPKAVAYTFVPGTFRQFLKQQLRWKKSWVRESFKAGKFIWKKNPIMSISFYLGVILPILAPVVVVRALIWYPHATGRLPYFYLFGLLLMAVVYGLYYYIYTGNKKWVYGVLFATFYTVILIWQLPWAILNLRDARWGTR
jgi:hyaluronan synthase